MPENAFLTLLYASRNFEENHPGILARADWILLHFPANQLAIGIEDTC